MKYNNPNIHNSATRLGISIGAGILATVAMLPQAQAEMVYEDTRGQQTQVRQSAQVEDREIGRAHV